MVSTHCLHLPDDTGKVCLKWVLKTSGSTLDSLPWGTFQKEAGNRDSRAMGTAFLCVWDVDSFPGNSHSPP